MKFQRPVTPAGMSGPLTALCKSIVPDRTPLYINVRPLNGTQSDECFPLVQNQVATYGGYLIVGWTLWELPAIFVEAEFHAVWRSPTGEFVDITPKNRPQAAYSSWKTHLGGMRGAKLIMSVGLLAKPLSLLSI